MRTSGSCCASPRREPTNRPSSASATAAARRSSVRSASKGSFPAGGGTEEVDISTNRSTASAVRLGHRR